MKNLYDESYFERGIEEGISCYNNYRWIPELTIPLCAVIIEKLNIREWETILDFGCAKGYMVKAFRLLYREAYGADISEYAISNSPEDVKKYIAKIEADECLDGLNHFDWIIAKDVLEHIEYGSIRKTLSSIRSHCKKFFAIVPLGNGSEYNVKAYGLDKTHIIKESLSWWASEMMLSGFSIVDANMNMRHIKSNWESYPDGNGFFIME